MKEGIGHLTSDTLQAYLEGELDERAGHEVTRHVAECRRCASEMEAWSLLFRELGELPALGPSEGFRDRVVGAIPPLPQAAPETLPERIRSYLGGLVGRGRAAAGHLSPEGMEALLEGAMGRRTRRHVEAHVAACGSCRSELESWKTVFHALDDLPSLTPSPAFAERVMAGVALRDRTTAAPARTRMLAELKEWAGGFLPSTRKGWALAGGIAVAPAVGLVAAVAAVVAHPLLTVGDLAAFLSWQAGDAIAMTGSWLIAQVVQMPILAGAYEVVAAAAGAPALTAASLAVLWSVTLAAGWILYKNVLSTLLVAERHVR